MGMGISNLVRYGAIALLAAACGKSESAADGDAGADAAAGNQVSGAAAPAPPGEGAKAQPAPGSGRIQVAIKDLQIFHPYAEGRAMPSVRDDGTFSTRDAKLRYGVGVIVEATNDTGALLRDAWFEGSLKLTGAGGQEIVCEILADSVAEFTGTRFLSYAPKPTGKPEGFTEEAAFGPKTDWKDESDSLLEAPWRPSERIRMVGRNNECDAPLAADIGATRIEGRIVVKARKRFVDVVGYDFGDDAYEMALDGEFVRIRDRRSPRVTLVPVKEVAEMAAASGAAAGSPLLPLSHVRLGRLVRASDADRVESEPAVFEVHPRALTLQLVKLPTGETEHASGNVVIRQKDGKVVYEEMARLKMSLLGVDRADLPATPPEVAFAEDELAGKVTAVTLAPSSEDTALAKGQRKLSVTWKLELAGGKIDGRLRAGLDAATAAFEAAERAAFTLEMDSAADKDAVSKAKAEVAKTRTAKTAAETKYKSGLTSERGRLAKLFVCGEARLATNKSVRAPSNAKAASDACKVLEKEDAVEVTTTYLLERYEVPVALVYSLGKTQAFKPIASEALLAPDLR